MQLWCSEEGASATAETPGINHNLSAASSKRSGKKDTHWQPFIPSHLIKPSCDFGCVYSKTSISLIVSDISFF